MRRMLDTGAIKPNYEAGEGITIEEDTIGADFNLVATCLYVDNRVPQFPEDTSKTYVLKYVQGVVQWVEEE